MDGGLSTPREHQTIEELMRFRQTHCGASQWAWRFAGSSQAPVSIYSHNHYQSITL